MGGTRRQPSKEVQLDCTVAGVHGGRSLREDQCPSVSDGLLLLSPSQLSGSMLIAVDIRFLQLCLWSIHQRIQSQSHFRGEFRG